MHYEGGLHKGGEVEELAGASLALLGSTQQGFCLCCILALHSPAQDFPEFTKFLLQYFCSKTSSGAGLTLLGGTPQGLCLFCILTLHSPAPFSPEHLRTNFKALPRDSYHNFWVRCRDCGPSGVTDIKPTKCGIG